MPWRGSGMKRNFSRRSGSGEELVGCRLRVVEDGATRDAWVLAFDAELGHLVRYSEQETWWEDLHELEVREGVPCAAPASGRTHSCA